ncbi:M48 family metalloprotease [Ramlibacter sp. H39-3-26]|uniref:M48 family metalloprotease n=1 Tax=Curvibacter soli TaxID=3031331 RepID=UPI0023DA9C15|nr:M48 family metalloprotease [Ramlibacter sp. H39-3-26]MDF1485186.1 M48 family metalloprotease [Ramlibacter sp. H39-3-26]
MLNKWRKTTLALINKALKATFLVASVAFLAPAITRAQLPNMGDGSELSASAERKLGDRIIRELYRDPDYIDDPVLVEYVQSIWQPLLAAARLRGEVTPEIDDRFAWQVLLGRDRTINAFALPGGYMGVYLGLIGMVGSRDELASVLAHETSHITQRHISRLMAQESRQTPLVLAAMILGALAASKSPDAANAMIMGGQAMAVQNQLNFSRDMEREADRIGFVVMTQAGFAPQGFVTMFEKLQQASRINDNGDFPYLRSHPLTSARIADMRSRMPLGVLAAQPLELDHAMVSARARVLSTAGTPDALHAWMAEAGTYTSTALEPARKAAVLYAAALSAQKARDFARARGWTAELAELVRSDARAARIVRLLAAEGDMAAGDPRKALADLGPLPATGMPRPELVLAAQARVAAGMAGQALPALQEWVVAHPLDALAWQQLASACHAAGQSLRAIRAEGEAQAAHKDYAAAIDRFKAGQNLARRGGPGADYIEASIIDTRLREMESLVREQAAER